VYPELSFFEQMIMRILVCFLFGLSLSASPMAKTGILESLADLRWKNRIILVDNATDRTVSALKARRAGIDERHVIWFCVVSGEIKSNYEGALGQGFVENLREDYFQRTEFPVLLIGKDGGIKSRNPSLDIDDYFLQIDGMPMRQAEMERSTPE
jgi:hypothetical protein